MRGVRRRIGERHLVRSERALRPAGRRRSSARSIPSAWQDDHRPAWARTRRRPPRAPLDRPDLGDHLVQRRGHQRVHASPDRRLRRRTAPSRSRSATDAARRAGCARGRSGWRSCIRSDAGSAAPRHRRPGSGTCSSATRWRAGRSPLRRRRHARHDQIGVVEHRAERVAQRVPELAALMDAARRFGRDVAWDAAGKRELPEQRLQPGLVAVTSG